MTPELMARMRFKRALAFLAVYLIWGSTYIAIVFAIGSIPPFIMASARFLLAGGVLYLWARWRGDPPPRPAQWGWALLLGGLFFLIGNGTVTWVEQRLASGLTALIVALVSVWTALLEWFRPGGARPSGLVLAGIALGFLGVAMLVLPGQSDGTHTHRLGILLLVGSTLAWALASVLSRTADLPPSAAMVSGMEMLAGGFLLLLASLVAAEWPTLRVDAITPVAVGAFLYLVVFGSLVTFTAFAWLLQVSTPNKVATAGYVNPMVAVFLGWALGGESLNGRTLAASAVIIGSVMLIITGRELTLPRPSSAAAVRDPVATGQP